MREAPVLLVVLRGEEAIVDAVAELPERGGDEFSEAFLVADFFHELLGGDEDALFAEEGEAEDLACGAFSLLGCFVWGWTGGNDLP